MSLTEAVQVLRDHNAWRRRDDFTPHQLPHDPKIIGQAIDLVCDAAPELLLSIAKRWVALDSGSWNADRHERDKRILIADTRAAIAKASAT